MPSFSPHFAVVEVICEIWLYKAIQKHFISRDGNSQLSIEKATLLCNFVGTNLVLMESHFLKLVQRILQMALLFGWLKLTLKTTIVKSCWNVVHRTNIWNVVRRLPDSRNRCLLFTTLRCRDSKLPVGFSRPGRMRTRALWHWCSKIINAGGNISVGIPTVPAGRTRPR